MIRKVLLRLGAALGFLALTACYANFRTEDYDSPSEMPRIAGLELDLSIRQVSHTPGFIYRDDGPYQLALRLSGKPGIHESATVHRLVVRDRSTGESWVIVPSPVVIPFQEDGSPQYYLAQQQFEKSFQPVFAEKKVLNVDIDISVKTKRGIETRRTVTIPFEGDSYEFKGFFTFEDLMGA
ncbi:MAG TPA: hypothetical protein VGE67_00275 [Haloferula sp.]